MNLLALGTPALAGLIGVALLFDLLNGLHDSANSIATVVSTRVLRPSRRWRSPPSSTSSPSPCSACTSPTTMGSGVLDSSIVDPLVVFGALGGAIVWNLLTWRLGIPSSSSHALVGGLVGAGIAKAGPAAVIWGGLGIIGAAIVLSPLMGSLLTLFLVLAVSWLSVRVHPVRRGPAISAPAIRVLIAAQPRAWRQRCAEDDGHHHRCCSIRRAALSGAFHVPFWVVLSCQAAMALGTLCGGWRIVRTMGSRITHLTPMQGFCAETGGAMALFGATWLGIRSPRPIRSPAP